MIGAAHPDEEALLACARGELPAETAAQVTHHLAECGSCRVVVAELARNTFSSAAAPGRVGEGASLGRYQLRGLVGSGGMGAVYSAWDSRLKRQVAVKVLHELRADSENRARRFAHEREILSGLDHPNIGHLFDSGETPDGRPYLVMEFVEGLPLDRFCDERRLTVAERVALFRTVCAAVHHAHQSLVVHRDLKPGNILVTRAGVPKLVDFGIAKLLQPGEGGAPLTATGQQPMTPAYASPEQVRREPITTAADVYALGVVLCELLAGAGPFEVGPKGIEGLLEAIREEDPEPPSRALSRAAGEAARLRGTTREKLRRQLMGDLDAIVLMALRKEPQRRYPSAEALAADLGAWLEGLPTSARRGTRAYRAWKFARRHKTSVAAAGAAFLALQVGAAAAVWQARVARHERDRANLRFEQVRKLAHAVLFDYHDGIAALPGSTSLREHLVKDSLDYLDSLAKEGSNDPALLRELATAYLKVGDVQGDPFSASLGDTAAALESYRRAQAICEALLAKSPGDLEAKKLLASSQQKVGAIVEVTGELKQALALYGEAERLDREVLARDPGDLDVRNAVSLHLMSAGQVQWALGDLEQASALLARALAEREALFVARPDGRMRRGLLIAHTALADVLRAKAQNLPAVEHYQKALELAEVNLEKGDSTPGARRDLGNVAQRLAMALSDAGKKDEAVKYQQRCLELSKQALAEDPKNAVARRDLASAQMGLAAGLFDLERFREALALDNASLAELQAIASESPGNAQARRDVAMAQFKVARDLTTLGDLSGAEAAYRAAAEASEERLAQDSSDARVREDAANARDGLGEVLLKKGRPAEALAELQHALALYDEAVKLAPDDGLMRGRAVDVNADLADAHQALAKAAGEGTRAGLEHARDACRFLHQQAAGWAALEEARAVPPVSAAMPKATARVADECDAALAKAGKRH